MTDSYEQEQLELERLHEQRRRGEARDRATRAAVYAQMAADAEEKRIAVEAAANIPAPETTEYPVQKLKWINGQVVPLQEESLSIAVSRIGMLTEINKAALKK